ncbi:nuclear pore complex protein Nup153 [Drosophila novamexicana]|uniref:nuclear pore complex protein Nup153 n=1 Tax=Drosophila novamexicana TaxID=47314 RepID=UPI0011E5AE9A|nr:nuclear pore complex protein Nup153 [Drosophila novamexicana]
MMSAFEDGQQQQQRLLQQEQQQQQQTQTPQPRTPLRLANEAANNNNNNSSSSSSSSSKNNNNSIMGKVKLRVSSILPDSLSKWFSPTADPNAAGAAAVAGEESSSSTSPQLPLSQHNGSALTTTIKQKHSRRRIQLEADDAPDIAVDDGTNAQDLNEEEVQLADNIAEHDLAGEDEQTRRSEYNVSLLRKRQLVANEDDDDDDDEDAEEEDDDEADDGPQPLNYRSQQPNRSVNFRSSAAQPLQKRKRMEPMESTFSPQFNAQRRRPQLHASTPAASDALRSQAPPNRFSTHLNLYGHQRQREPAYNFMSAGNNSSSEAAVATSGDLPMSSRRSLNIAPMTERREMALPSYKRQSLLGHRGLMPNWRSYQTISEVPNEEQQQQQPQQTMRQETNNNNNNIIQTKRSGGTDSQSECESNESHAAGGSGFGYGRMNNLNNNNNNINSNSNQLFYGNLQSRKSVFNTNVNATSLLQHHNSTLSLNSLNHRRRFNASIYGSTSALSDSRLLSSSMSGNSPFYQGPTAFGGSSANNRYFSQGNLPINSGGSSPAPSNSDSVCSNSNPARPNICHSSYGMKPIEMRPRGNLCTGAGDGSANVPGLSLTAQRILNLLENHTTPLMDAKKMGSTLREHQLQRSSRHLTAGSKPYSYPNHTLAFGYNNTAGGSSNNNRNSDPDNSSKLLVPTMLQLLERRRLHRVAPSTRALVDAKQLEEQQMLHQQHQQAANLAANSNTTVTVTATATGSQSHTNKMRSRLSHQLRKDARIVDEQQLPPAPLDLPNIRFPVMASEPTFDLVIAPPPPVSAAATTVQQQQQLPKLNNNNNNTNKTNNNSSIRRRGNSSTRYQFATPQPLNCADPAGTTAAPQKRMKHNFIFDPPVPLDEPTKCLPNSLQFNGATCNSNLKSTGSVIDVLLPPKRTEAPAAAPATAAPLTTGGFGDQFKKSASEWECEACMLRNKQELNKCVACETPKPKPKGAANSAASGPTAPAINYPAEDETARLKTTSLGTQVCMSSIAQNSGSNSSSFGSSNSNSFPSGFGDAFKPPANMWECGCCMIMNPASLNECLACQSPNPKSSNSNSNSSTNNNSNSNNSFKFGFEAAAAGTAVVQPKADAGFQQLIAAQKSSSWNCEACMAQNDISRNKCICCEQLKPGTTVEEASTTAAVPKFMFGFPAKAASTAATEAGATTTAATATVAPVTQFKFGFAPAAAVDAGKDVADSNKALTTTTTTTTTVGATTFSNSSTTTATTNVFKIGTGTAAKTVDFKLGDNAAQQQQLSLATDKPAPASSSMAPATSSSGQGLFATTTVTPAAATTFAFGANTATTTATTIAAAAGKPVESKLFNFGSFTPNTAVSSSTSTSTNTTSSSSSGCSTSKATTSKATTSFATTAAAATPFANNPATSVATSSTTLPIFGSSSQGCNLFGSSNTATKTTNAMQPLAVSSPFGMATTTTTTSAAAAAAATVQPNTGGNATISAVFGNVNSPFGTNTAPGAGGVASPLTNIFNSSSSSNNKGTPTTTAAAATTVAAATPKPAFNFVSANAPIAAPAGGVFNFGATPTNAAASGSSNSGGNSSALPKPAFNFTATAPQTTAFNFSANSTTAGGNAGNSDFFPRTERLFQFGATAASTDAGGTSSTMMPAAANQLFNFTASAQQMQSTPNAAPFQFNAGAPAPANIFAFNPPNAGSAMQNPRRKIRGPTRRLPPR